MQPEHQYSVLKAQDSRMLLQFGLNDSENASPDEELEATAEADAQTEDPQNGDKPEVGEEEIKDLEILFPEEKE